MKIIALIDGEHYLPVTIAALKELGERVGKVVGTVFIGGIEKLKSVDSIRELGFPYTMDKDRFAAVRQGLQRFRPDLVYDLSDEPVVSYEDRFQLANLILEANVSYAGADFRFDPPRFADVMRKPSLTIAGTGKRIGKTAIGGYVGRTLSSREKGGRNSYHPCIVTMGRGGPPHPEIIRGEDIELTPLFLMNEFKEGKHAASDHYEDALIARLTTIGCRRCGGGFTGQVFSSVVEQGATIANKLPHKLVIFEGSGASFPPIRTDSWIMLVGANQPYNRIQSYMGPYRLNKADLILITQCDKPLVTDVRSLRMRQISQKIAPKARVVRTRFRPKPLKSITGKKIIWITTLPKRMAPVLKSYLEETYGCQVCKISHSLSNRPKLKEELNRINLSLDAVLVELKAAAVDMATRWGLKQNLDVIYQDNIPISVDRDLVLADEVIRCAELAKKRFGQRS
ncbi:MAG: hypothetical protein B6244_01280 [Candidatus Cloacimonetes bacterium 4572_55]|nr:MAG: hypothetical protein B6244_01280 [Candidatus Cloacimonetes bacterium 4572_55]